jgi:hypothetical protein
MIGVILIGLARYCHGGSLGYLADEVECQPD